MDFRKLFSLPIDASSSGYKIDLIIYLVHAVMFVLFLGWAIYFIVALLIASGVLTLVMVHLLAPVGQKHDYITVFKRFILFPVKESPFVRVQRGNPVEMSLMDLCRQVYEFPEVAP